MKVRLKFRRRLRFWEWEASMRVRNGIVQRRASRRRDAVAGVLARVAAVTQLWDSGEARQRLEEK